MQIRIKTEGSNIKIQPEDWRKKHDTMRKKKPEKSPDMGTYNPVHRDYELLEDLAKVKTTNKNLLGRVERFKTEASGSGLNPTKYNVIQEWKGKDSGKMQRHGLDVLSSKAMGTKSVYYH